MKVRSFLNGKAFEELAEEELRKFTVEAQVKMLKIAGYAPIEINDNIKSFKKSIDFIDLKEVIRQEDNNLLVQLGCSNMEVI